MKTISRTFYKMPVNTMFMVLVPLFFFLFVLAYRPFNLDVFLAPGGQHYTLNLIICTLIVLGVMSLSRMLLFILRRSIDLNAALYVIWCVGEAVLCGLFMSIPMGIGWAGVRPYFSVMSLCVLYMAGILVFPVSILSLAVQVYVLSKEAVRGVVPDEKTLIRFHDDQKRLKLVVSSEQVLYIEAEDNYVHVVHLDNGRVKDFNLRASMRSLEELLLRHGLVRCHRSYFVNPKYVKLLSKNRDGIITAELLVPEVEAIPVSKQFYKQLSELL